MQISEHDRQQIELVNDQVCLLLEKNAPESAIFDALMDFVPDMKCLLECADDSELKMYIDANRGFAYFINLLTTHI